MAVATGERLDEMMALANHAEASDEAGGDRSLVALCQATLLCSQPAPERLTTVLSQVRDHLAADRAAVWMLDDDSRLHIVAALGLDDADRAPCLEIGEGLSGYVARNGEALLIRCMERDDRFRHRRHERYFRGSLISAPLVHGGAVRGAISICRSRHAFCGRDLDLLEQVAFGTAPIAAQALE